MTLKMKLSMKFPKTPRISSGNDSSKIRTQECRLRNAWVTTDSEENRKSPSYRGRPAWKSPRTTTNNSWTGGTSTLTPPRFSISAPKSSPPCWCPQEGVVSRIPVVFSLLMRQQRDNCSSVRNEAPNISNNTL
ncbi:hypothetical protein JTB14_016308 [Gonioctena quinquepunctata]|nr:hypothetical protein JTB14_016308 [Gonioctena quinquepunctata]